MSLKEFYRGKTVLLTGGTGFIGRLILSKLLRLGNVKEILLLSRPKKGRSNDNRLNYALTGVLFEEVQKSDPNFKNKLRIINGDMELEKLGISKYDREYIRNNVDVMIHGAATVRFDEELKKAIAINIYGTKNMLELAMEVKNLQSFVYLSTAYSQCPLSEIKEEFYEPPMDYKTALNLCENFDNEVVNALTRKLIAPWPNTYTFTKSIAEDLIRQHLKYLPIALIRPTIVQSTFVDPVPGFCDKIIGPIGMAVGVLAGVIRIVKNDPSVCLDIIPADIVVNSTLLIAAEASKRDINSQKIFTTTICNVRKTSISFALSNIAEQAVRSPTRKMIWLPVYNGTSSNFLFKFYFVLYHYIPALFFDIISLFRGSKESLISLYSKVYYQTQLLDYFMMKSWQFDDKNMKGLYKKMSPQDLADFPVLFCPEQYEVHVVSGTRGLVRNFFKENDEDLKVARKRYKVFYILHNILLAIVYSFYFYLLNNFLTYLFFNVNK